MTIDNETLDAMKWAAEMMGYATYQLKSECAACNRSGFDDALYGLRAAITKHENDARLASN